MEPRLQICNIYDMSLLFWKYLRETFSGFFHTNCMVVAPVNVASLRHYKNGLCFSVDDVYLKQEK